MPQPRRRWACFPTSIVSDVENQGAHLYRAMARHIASLQDEARFYEERANPWLRNMLVRNGASSLLAFQERHPEVDYTTFDPRSGADLADWLTRVLATVDIVTIDSSAPRDIVRWVGELTRPHLHTFLIDTTGQLARQPESIERIEFYTGICVADPEGESTVLPVQPEQYLIPIEPALPTSGTVVNGNAQGHVDQAASRLVEDIVRAVDESLLRSGDGL